MTNYFENGRRKALKEIQNALSDYKLEKHDATQVDYKYTRPGARKTTRKQSGWLVTQPDGYERFFDTKKLAQDWINSQE